MEVKMDTNIARRRNVIKDTRESADDVVKTAESQQDYVTLRLAKLALLESLKTKIYNWKESLTENKKKWGVILNCLWRHDRSGPNFVIILCMLGCVLVLIGDRGINIMLPLVNKRVINSLTDSEQGHGKVAPNWSLILFYILLKTLHGKGFLGSIRSALWLKVAQYARKAIRLQLFDTIMAQSLRWHLTKKTGEVTKIIDRGVNSLNSIVSQVLFNLVPAVVDVCVAVIFFLSAFDFWTGLVVFGSMVGYLLSNIFLGKKRKIYRQQQNEAENQRQNTVLDALLNFETVKFHAAEDFELDRFSDAIDKVMEAEWNSNMSVAVVQFAQQATKNLGLLGGSLLCAFRVSEGTFTVGDYMLFVTYLGQVYSPLNTFGGYLRTLQQNLIDLETLAELLQQVPEIKDKVDAKELVVTHGKVEFRDIRFHYNPDREILKSVSFTVEPGKTVALVGHSGSGKTTLTRLLMRLFEPQEGSVLVDGQDVSNVTQKSLRSNIGIVPQDTVLFNKDVMYNICYSKPQASDEEVERAAQDASIHERIMSFPEGYQTKVGERGLRLSGGEKQRIAIARTLLKDAAIVILDEATSALDSHTETLIQETLATTYSSNTTLVVAHRLSTIVNADVILVFNEGEIVERGCHSDLLEKEGHYFNLWSKQQLGTSMPFPKLKDYETANKLEECFLDKDSEINSSSDENEMDVT